jgi:hypothetical protein
MVEMQSSLDLSSVLLLLLTGILAVVQCKSTPACGGTTRHELSKVFPFFPHLYTSSTVVYTNRSRRRY